MAVYREALRTLPVPWEPYLREHSGLPGPRGNLELMQAVADEAPTALLYRYAQEEDEYLAACGTVGLGRLLAAGDDAVLPELHRLAGDERWRVREAAAMALQRVGDADEARMLRVAEKWAADSSLLVHRAAIAGVCEPRLLTRPATVERVFDVLDRATGALAAPTPEQTLSEPRRVLRLALAYCWSVAVAAAPETGFDRFERWVADQNRDVRWILRQNLTKARMRKADPQRWQELEQRLAV